MKKYILLFIISLFMATSCKDEKKDEIGKYKTGIVFVSGLNSRKEPNVKSEIVGKFPFGSPINIDFNTDYKDVIDGIEGYWVKEKKYNGYVFSGFLYLSEFNPEILKGKVEICNFPCGGGCFVPPGTLYLIGDYYVTIQEHLDYLTEEYIPCSTIKIGKIQVNNDNYIFEPPIKVAGYEGKDKNCRYKYIKNLDKVGEERILKKVKKSFKLTKKVDKVGEYYIIDGKKIQDRSLYKKYCSDNSNQYEPIEIFDRFYVKLEEKNGYDYFLKEFYEPVIK